MVSEVKRFETHQIFQVDAFTDRLFSGNPAAIVLVREMPDNEWMQHVAAEMNVSETAFVAPLQVGRYHLRWFTPVMEVDLCGHATLAAAHVLWDSGALGTTETAEFETAGGLLRAERDGEWIEMDFPAERPEEIDEQLGITAALSVEPVYVGSNRLDILVELPDEAAVRGLDPDMHAIEQVGLRGVIVTAQASTDQHTRGEQGAGERYHFVSRYFAPRFGIPEDPVTGSAHCCLGPYWHEKLGENPLVGYQASARGGTVGVEVLGDRVKLRGRAVSVFSGTLNA